MKKIILGGFVFCAAIFALFVNSQTSNAQNAKWETIDQQLSKNYLEFKISPNSELERLVRENQDFSMLRADEINDTRNLPPWLRVWWRKAHPEETYSAADPTKGYPLVLKEILEWMLTHQDLKVGPGVAEEPDGDADFTVVGTNTRVSGAPGSRRSESDIRVNYFDSQKILSGSNNISGGGAQGMYASIDGGTTWTQSLLPFATGDTSHSDPTAEWTSDGTAWASTLGIVGSTLRLRNYFSTNNGATWTLDATPSGTQTNVDKQMVWVDHSATSPFKDRQYAIWHNGSPAFMNRRTAGVAGTWLATPLQVNGAESTGTNIGGDVKTNSAGDVFGFYPATGNRRISVVKSTTGGDSFGPSVQIGTTFDSFDIGVPSFNNRRAFVYLSGGAFKTATKNNVYASWTDLSGETGCTAAANEPGANVASVCKTRIWFSRSTDGGATWSPAVKINNQPGLNDQFNHWLYVDEVSGMIAIMYYDTVADAGRKKTHVYYQKSVNDGVTWLPAIKVTTAQTDETTGGQDTGNQFGDYNGLSGFGTTIFPVWTDRRGGALEEVWTAKITQNLFPLFDFDGDGRSDQGIFNANGDWVINQSGTNNLLLGVHWGIAGDKLAPADFDGDGRTDFCVWREAAQSTFYILTSGNFTFRQDSFGITNDSPITVGDWDGDGKADPAVYREAAQSTFFYRGSLNNPGGNITFVPWGIMGDKAVRGDFDGDGKQDAAIYRPSNQVWYVRQSSNGALAASFFGLPSDKRVPSDYDGDNKTDVAIFRDGLWVILQSSNGQAVFQGWGLAGDKPVPADFDGDGKSDVAVYRSGVWWILRSNDNSFVGAPFGTATDVAIPTAFAQ